MTTTVQQNETECDPLAAKLDALVPASEWANRTDYERYYYDQDGGYQITESATITASPLARVRIVRETTVTGDLSAAHTIESVRVAHADEDFWIETHCLADLLAEIRTAAVEAGVTL